MEGKKIHVFGQLPDEKPVLLAQCNNIAEFKEVKEEYKSVFPEIIIASKIVKDE